MWQEGAMKIQGFKVRYQAKVYDTGSEYGINGGRISKLLMKQDKKVVAAYDRGWDMEPSTPEAQIALQILLEEYGQDAEEDDDD